MPLLPLPCANRLKLFVKSLRCGAERLISKGEQLLHTYGDLSDAQLLQTYGFVEEFEPGYDNPHNFVPVPSQLVLQSCSESGDEVSHALPCLAQCVAVAADLCLC